MSSSIPPPPKRKPKQARPLGENNKRIALRSDGTRSKVDKDSKSATSKRSKPSSTSTKTKSSSSETTTNKTKKSGASSTSNRTKTSSSSNKTKGENGIKKERSGASHRTKKSSSSSNKSKIALGKDVKTIKLKNTSRSSNKIKMSSSSTRPKMSNNIRQDGTSSQLKKERNGRRKSGKMITENPSFNPDTMPVQINSNKNNNNSNNYNNNNNNFNSGGGKLPLTITTVVPSAPINTGFEMEGYSTSETNTRRSVPRLVVILGMLVVVVGLCFVFLYDEIGGAVDDIQNPVNVVLIEGIVNLKLNDEIGMSNEVRIAFKEAANFWNTIIVNDLEDSTTLFDFRNEVVNNCKNGDLQLKSDGSITVQGVEIVVRIEYIDGLNQILGQAAPCVFQLLPNTKNEYRVRGGVMTFDEVDLQELVRKKSLSRVIIHEMGHVLGLGTLWRVKGTVVAPFITGVGFKYNGTAGLESYKSDLNGQLDSPPVENDFGAGTAGGHWSEEVFGNELMTGFINDNTDNPLSIMSIKALKDLGYTVRENTTEIYSIPTPKTSLRGNSNSGDDSLGIDLRGDVVFDSDDLSTLLDEVRRKREASKTL